MDQYQPLANLLLRHFRGREDHVAVGGNDGTFSPLKWDNVFPPVGCVNDHLSGNNCYGFYLLTETSECYCSCVDFDNKPQHPDPEWQTKTQKVYDWLIKADLSPLVEISQSGDAAHVWLFFEEPVSAWVIRSFWRGVSAQIGIPFAEVYPRQDKLTGGKGLGNLIRYPLWNKSRFVDVEDDWKTLDPSVALSTLRKTNEPDLRGLSHSLGIDLRPEGPVYGLDSVPVDESDGLSLPSRVQSRIAERKNSLLARRWRGDTEGMGRDQSRTALALAICCELVRQYIPTPEIEAALYYWGRENGIEDRMRGPGWMHKTISKAYELVKGRNSEASSNLYTTHSLAKEYLDLSREGNFIYWNSGIKELDDVLLGVSPGEMVLVAARPGHGKTALLAQWLDYQASLGTRSLFVSEDMGLVQLGKRFVSRVYPVHPKGMLPGEVDEASPKVDEHYGGSAPVYVVESCKTIERVEQLVEEQVRMHKVQVVGVDYVQLLGNDSSGGEYEVITDVCKRLKRLTHRFGIGMIGLAQLSRPLKGYEDKIPELSDLKNTGQLEQDADKVIFLQWPDKFTNKKQQYDPLYYRVIVGKNRNGEGAGSVIDTVFNPKRQLIGQQYQEGVIKA